MLELLPGYDDIYWRQPWWLLLALQPLLLALLRRRLGRQRADRFVEPALQPWVVVRHQQRWPLINWRAALRLLAWLLFAISVAGPGLLLDHDQLNATPQGNILLLVDVSRSMQASDDDPGHSRLRRAQIEIDEFLSHAPHHRIGIILFAARAHLYVPLSADYNALRFYLAQLDKLRLPTAGSRPQQAITLANTLLAAASADGAIILLSDGDWPATESIPDPDGRPSFPVFTLGIGSTAASGIPLADGSWLEHAGQPVVSGLNEARLKQFAERRRGTYSRATADSLDWQRLYDRGVAAQLPHMPAETNPERGLRLELYHYSLVPALALLLLSLLPGRRAVVPAMTSATLVIGLLFLLPHHPAEASELAEQAYQRYQQQDYAGALERYRRIDGFQGRLGEGAAHYRLGDYDQAVGRFIAAVLAAQSDHDRATALFNLGNSYFRRGDYANAATAFNDALLYRPDSDASRFNLQFSQALQQAVLQQREQRAARAARAGRGPSSATPAEGTVIGDDSSLSLSDSDSSSLLPLPDLPADPINQLLQRGLDHIQLADRSAERQAKRAAQRREIALADARLRMALLQDNQPALWIRLFEMEEGFPAPLSEPQPVPGVPAW